MPEASQLQGLVVTVWLYQGWYRLTLFVCLTAAFAAVDTPRKHCECPAPGVRLCCWILKLYTCVFCVIGVGCSCRSLFFSPLWWQRKGHPPMSGVVPTAWCIFNTKVVDESSDECFPFAQNIRLNPLKYPQVTVWPDLCKWNRLS